MRHLVEWRTPAPLWDLAIADGGPRPRLRQPALLRFDAESFMEDIAGVLTDAPERLADFVAKPETWEEPDAGWADAGDDSTEKVLKLFQPAQNRFYLVAASLICPRTGLPERKVDVAADEKVGVVVRRLVAKDDDTFDPNDASTYNEHVWIGNREAGEWQIAPTAGKVAKGEELLPLFPIGFDFESRSRRLHVGGIPVAGREVYEMSAPSEVEAAPLVSEPDDPLIELQDYRKALWAEGPQTALGLYADTKDVGAGGSGDEMSNANARELLRHTLLDVVDFFRVELPQLWAAIDAGSGANLDASSTAVFDALNGVIPNGVSWRTALRRTDEQRDALLLGVDPPTASQPAVPDSVTRANIGAATATLLVSRSIDERIYAALDETEDTEGADVGAAPTEAAGAIARAATGAGSFYVLRCVYDQPRCRKFFDPIVSVPSRPFQFAAFYDPEAPVRPVTVRLPEDTSIGGLAKFPKGVTMVMSDSLRQKVEHLQNLALGDIDDGNIGDPPPAWGIGMICSFSIPIITLCAFIVLMIFIQLLNIVFWWLPFLKVCLPIPVKKN